MRLPGETWMSPFASALLFAWENNRAGDW